MADPDTYEDFAAWFGARYTGPASVTVGEAMREFTGTSADRLLAWWERYRLISAIMSDGRGWLRNEEDAASLADHILAALGSKRAKWAPAVHDDSAVVAPNLAMQQAMAKNLATLNDLVGEMVAALRAHGIGDDAFAELARDELRAHSRTLGFIPSF